MATPGVVRTTSYDTPVQTIIFLGLPLVWGSFTADLLAERIEAFRSCLVLVPRTFSSHFSLQIMSSIIEVELLIHERFTVLGGLSQTRFGVLWCTEGYGHSGMSLHCWQCPVFLVRECTFSLFSVGTMYW